MIQQTKDALRTLVRRIVDWSRSKDERGPTTDVRRQPWGMWGAFPIGVGAGSWNDPPGSTADRTRLAYLEDCVLIDERVPAGARALDIFADYVAYGDKDTQKTFSVSVSGPKSDRAQSVIERSFELSEVHDNTWSRVRGTCQFGSWFGLPVYDTYRGLVGVRYLPSRQMWIDVLPDGRPRDPNAYYLQRPDASSPPQYTWPDKYLIHWKNDGDPSTPYGRSVFHAARGAYRDLLQSEQAMTVGRMTHSQGRLVFHLKMATAALTEEEKIFWLQRYRQLNEQVRVVDPVTGQYRIEDSPMLPNENIYLTDGDKVSELRGEMNVTHIADIEYHLQRFRTAVGIPNAFLGHEKDINAKATLTEQKVAFLRTVRRMQVSDRRGIKTLAAMSLVACNMDPDSLKTDIIYPEVSAIDQLLEYQTMELKCAVAIALRDELMMFDEEWIYTQVFGCSDAEADDLAKRGAKVKAAAAAAQQAGGGPPTAAIPGASPTSGGAGGAAGKADAQVWGKTVKSLGNLARLGRPPRPKLAAAEALRGLNIDALLDEVKRMPEFSAKRQALAEALSWRLEAATGRERDVPA